MGDGHTPFSQKLVGARCNCDSYIYRVQTEIWYLLLVLETEYTIVYVPSVAVSTVPEDVIDEVKSPSTLSEAVAPASVNVSPTPKLIVDSPTREMTGG